MESYTIEDIEVIRQKSGLSYQDAVALLDYHNGNLARALIDLERNGRLKDDTAGTSATRNNNVPEQGLRGLLNRLLRFRLKISRNNVPIINLSVLFSAFVIWRAPGLAAISGILALLLGCNFSFDRDDRAFAGDSIQKMVRNAGENAKKIVHDAGEKVNSASFSVNFGEKDKEEKSSSQPVEEIRVTPEEKPVQDIDDATETSAMEDTAPEKAVESYFAGNPAVARGTAFSSSSVPTIQVPVQVETVDGNVSVENNDDGYTTLTID